MSELKLWKGGCDLVIAETAEEAAKLAQAETGVEEDPDDFDEYTKPLINILNEDESPNWRPVVNVIAENGRGWLLGFEP